MIKISDHIIEEDNDLVAINKPAGLLSIPDREGKDVSLKSLLKEKYGEIFTVHRLDRETSGIIVFAKNETAHKSLSQQFENRETKKIYYGLVMGSPSEAAGIVNEPISEHPAKKGYMTVYKKGKESITEYALLENYRIYSWMQFRILTGRTHQIRVHMKHLGHPIVCDDMYGDGKPVFISAIKKKNYKLSRQEDEERPILARLALHAARLEFSLNKKSYNLEAETPKDIRALLNQLRKHQGI